MKRLTKLLMAALLLLSAELHAAPPIREFNPDSLPAIVASQHGQPFVLVVWSLDCEYCQASLKLLSEKQKADKSLKVVTLGTDSLQDPALAGLMRKRLAELKLGNNAWAFGASAPEQLRFAIDRKWRGEMPRSYWFNANGNATALSGVITPEAVDRFLSGK